MSEPNSFIKFIELLDDYADDYHEVQESLVHGIGNDEARAKIVVSEAKLTQHTLKHWRD